MKKVSCCLAVRLSISPICMWGLLGLVTSEFKEMFRFTPESVGCLNPCVLTDTYIFILSSETPCHFQLDRGGW